MALVYYAIKKLGLCNKVDIDLLSKWKKKVFNLSLREKFQKRNIEIILSKFNENNINVIALKGTILKELYSNPDFRTMGDCDLLIKKSDISICEKVLNFLGYKKKEGADNHSIHRAFYKDNYSVELHWALVNKEYFNGSNKFESSIWENIVPYNVVHSKVYKLNHEYMIIHLIAHMAVHGLYNGFGIRQLLDLYLYSKRYEDNINWEKVSVLLQETSLLNFSLNLYEAIRVLFSYKLKAHNLLLLQGHKERVFFNNIHCEKNPLNCSNEYYYNELIENILENGVFGKKNREDIFVNTVINARGESNKLKYARLIFPAAEVMKSKYKYAEKYTYLLPLAYGHRLINAMFNRSFSVKDKYNFLFKTVKKADKKEKLLKNLGLK